jgi:hypothetical protein
MSIAPIMTQALCLAGGLWAVLASSYIPEDQLPKDFYDNNALDQTFGGSCIINPFGQIVAGPENYKETIIYHDIDLKMNVIAKARINLKGIYSRWDILDLCIRGKQYEPLVFLEAIEAKIPSIANAEAEELRAKIKLLEEKLRAIEQIKPEQKKDE